MTELIINGIKVFNFDSGESNKEEFNKYLDKYNYISESKLNRLLKDVQIGTNRMYDIEDRLVSYNSYNIDNLVNLINFKSNFKADIIIKIGNEVSYTLKEFIEMYSMLRNRYKDDSDISFILGNNLYMNEKEILNTSIGAFSIVVFSNTYETYDSYNESKEHDRYNRFNETKQEMIQLCIVINKTS